MTESDTRRNALSFLCSDREPVAELLDYCRSPFKVEALQQIPVFPMRPERHVADWSRYVAEAGERPFEYLQQRLPQLNIPIRAGVSGSDEYSAVVFEGQAFDEAAFGGCLSLRYPESFRVFIHDHQAGPLPVLLTGDRGDFATIWQALVARSEPKPLGPTVNAQMVSGVINWDRVEQYRRSWAAGRDAAFENEHWAEVLTQVAESDPSEFYDRFILVCTGAYSGVPAAALGLQMTEPEWIECSTALRVEHEFAHYATKRLYGSMRLNLHDELIADFMGITHALGRFRAEWFLTFLGLERWPAVRPEGRVHVYRGSLSDAAFAVMCGVAHHAAHAVERVATRLYDPQQRGRFLLALTLVTPDILASPDGDAAFAEAYARAAAYVRGAEAA